MVEALSSLVDKSLVQSSEEGIGQRFTMLRTVRDFAAERLASVPELAGSVREAHARYFSKVAARLGEEVRGPRQQSALTNLEADLGNLRTAWAFWIDRCDIDQALGLIDGLWALHASKGWYHAAIDLAKETLHVLDASGRSGEFAAQELVVRTNLARALMAVGGYNEEVEWALDRALALAEAGGITREEFPMLRALASIYIQRTSWDAAKAIGRQMLTLAEREDDRGLLAEGHYVIGASALLGDPVGALAELEEAIALFGPASPAGERLRLGPSSAVLARTASSLLLWNTGAFDRAVARMDESLTLARAIHHPYTVAYALYHSGFLAISRGRFEECAQHARELAGISATHDYPIWSTLAKLLEGVATAALGQPDEGLAMTEGAVELYRGLTPPPVFWPFVLTLRAAVYTMSGQPKRAVELLEEASAAAGSLHLDPPALRAMLADTMRLLADPDHSTIEAHYLRAIEVGKATGLIQGALAAANGLVTLRRERGSLPDGSAELAAIFAMFKEGVQEHDLVIARELLGIDDRR